MKEERSLIKSGNDYVLEIVNKEANLFQRKTYTKTEMKNNYDSIITQLRMHREQISKVKKDLKEEPKYSAEEIVIKDVVLKVLLNQKFDKLSVDLNRMNDEVVLFTKQMKEIEGLIPEFKRG